MPRLLSKICDALDPYVDLRSDWRAIAASGLFFIIVGALLALAMLRKAHVG
jgi:hypothetical protein